MLANGLKGQETKKITMIIGLIMGKVIFTIHYKFMQKKTTLKIQTNSLKDQEAKKITMILGLIMAKVIFTIH